MMKKTVKALSIAAIASAASLAVLPDAQAGEEGATKVAMNHEGCDGEKGCGAHEGCNACAADEGCNPCAACSPCEGDEGCNPCGGY